MTTYYHQLESPTNDKLTQLVQVGRHTIHMDFQWAIASQEQLDMILRYIERMANSDPIVRSGHEYDRSYNYVLYYTDLAGVDLDTWLDSNPDLPKSLIGKSRDIQKTALYERISEMSALLPTINQYLEVLRWQVKVTTDGTHQTIAVVEPGGWFRNQDNTYAFRFMSEKAYIGREDLNKVYVEFEVYDE